MSFISFNYNKNLNYAIAYWALEIIIRIFMYFNWEFFQISVKDSINEYIYLILLDISDLLAGFLVIYTQCSMKQKNKNKNEDVLERRSTINKIEYISVEEKSLHKSKSFIYKMILICILDYINRAAFYIFYQTNKDANHENISHKAQKDIIIHLDILARYAFSILLLKNKIFKHHKLSIILITIGFIILIPIDIMEIINSKKIEDRLSYIYIGMFVYRGILFPLEDTIVKQVYMNEYIFPEYIMFFRGVGELILLIIITPILYFCLWSKESFGFVNNTTQVTLNIIIYTISSFVKAYLLLKIIYYFSSQSVSFLIISESLTGSICSIIKFFKFFKKLHLAIAIFVVEIIVILITTFATLIYDEIIVIKKCGLDVNVAKQISKRAKLETNSISFLNENNNAEEEEEDEDKDEEIKEDDLENSKYE